MVKGKPFWSLPKRPPTALVFNKKDPKHQMFVASLACLRATIFHIEIPTENPRTDKFRAQVAEDADFFKPPPFKPNDAKAKEIQEQVNKQDNKGEEKEEESKDDDKAKIDEDAGAQRLADFKKLVPTLKIDKSKIEKTFIAREDFEKDNDKNYHIDFIYSMANCRSLNYTLDEMDWLTVKLKAGKIVPALATTTASIAGLQTLEMIKVLTKTPKVHLKSHNLNLAVQVMPIQEPPAVTKEKLLEGLEVSIWDRWDIKDFAKGTLQQMMTQLEELHPGLELIDVKKGNTDIYAQFYMNQESKKALKKKTLASTVRELTDSENEPYVDLTVTMKRKDDDKAADVLKFVPPVRVFFQ
jgi:hypothetical protein